jgi:hypothetical protein
LADDAINASPTRFDNAKQADELSTYLVQHTRQVEFRKKNVMPSGTLSVFIVNTYK